MPKFDTPEPITANIEPGVGSVTIVAGDRVDTVVEIRPTNPDNEFDTAAAERTTVDFAGNTLTIRGSKINPLIGPNKKTGSTDITVELPAGSHVHGKTAMGDVTATGRLGDVSYKTGLGDVRFDEAATLSVTSGTGTVLGNRTTGKATITTAGRVHVGELADGGVLKNSNGDTVVGAARGPVRVRAANGDITVEESADDVEAKSANGTVRVLDAVRGSLTLETAMGEIEVGIRAGSAAWLDVKTKFGRVRNEMTASGAPAEHADRVEIHANTAFGDVTVRRA
jgi:DUF4097 and DUF4098 domain-containing protein YvlB